MLYKLVLCFSLWCLFNSAVTAQKQVRVISHLSEGWATAEGIGFAQEMFRRISTLTGEPNELEVYPLMRAILVMNELGGQCYFAGNASMFENPPQGKAIQVHSSIPFTQDDVRALTLNKIEKISGYNDLKDKSVLITTGLPETLEAIPEFSRAAVNYAVIDHTADYLAMLEANRADVIIRYVGNLPAEDKKHLHFHDDFLIYSQTDSINCYQRDDLLNYIHKINQAIELGLRTGAFDDLYLKYNRIKPELPKQ